MFVAFSYHLRVYSLTDKKMSQITVNTYKQNKFKMTGFLTLPKTFFSVLSFIYSVLSNYTKVSEH